MEQVGNPNEYPHWHNVTIQCPESARDAVGALLHEMGTSGLLEGEDGLLIAYFPPAVPLDRLRSGIDDVLGMVRTRGDHRGDFHVSIQPLPDQDWNETWKASFVPIDVGDDIVILPPWKAGEYDGGRFPLYIDPGMAFGTGHHETTRDCVLAVSRCAHLLPDKGPMLDLGTGTGILAIHGTLLGFGPVLALDLDPAAVDAALRNARWNGVEDQIHVVNGKLDDVTDGPFALITANLLLNILVDYMPRLRRLLAPGAILVLSGILSGQEEPLRNAIRDAGLSVAERMQNGNWVTMIVSA